jgi:hypothetical protein
VGVAAHQLKTPETAPIFYLERVTAAWAAAVAVPPYFMALAAQVSSS